MYTNLIGLGGISLKFSCCRGFIGIICLSLAASRCWNMFLSHKCQSKSLAPCKFIVFHKFVQWIQHNKVYVLLLLPGNREANPGDQMKVRMPAAWRFVLPNFQHSHYKDVNEQYFKCCHVLPLRMDCIYLSPFLFDKPYGSLVEADSLGPYRHD